MPNNLTRLSSAGEPPTASGSEAECCHCGVSNFGYAPLHTEASGRSYAHEVSQKPPSVSKLNSPVRIGDSFEDLKRKMLRFDELSPREEVKTDDPRAETGGDDAGSKQTIGTIAYVQQEGQEMPAIAATMVDGVLKLAIANLAPAQ